MNEHSEVSSDITLRITVPFEEGETIIEVDATRSTHEVRVQDPEVSF